MTPDEKIFLAEAARYFERPSFWLTLTNRMGAPLERGLALLPSSVSGLVAQATQAALRAALKAAITSLPKPKGPARDFHGALAQAKSSRFGHDFAAAATGAAGGFFGVAALLLELPVTTTVMLRSIARSASLFGEDLQTPEGQLECMFVFATGGGSKNAEAVESAYFSARYAFSSVLKEAASYVAKAGAHEAAHQLTKKSAPVLVRLLAQVAARFEVVVSDKAVAQLLPVAGAVSGAALNLLFIEHFEALARYHFGLRHLERKYSAAEVRSVYDAASKALP